jgi:uridine kinase
MIVVMRGKAATGKTSIANKIAQEMGFYYISKDMIFDQLLNDGWSWDHANERAYDHLIKSIQTMFSEGRVVVLDLGLAHTPYYLHFLEKLNIIQTMKFLFVCSDDKRWEERIQRRIEKPQGPNQAFKSVEEARLHYEKYQIVPLEDELVVDSIQSIQEMKTLVTNHIKRML